MNLEMDRSPPCRRPVIKCLLDIEKWRSGWGKRNDLQNVKEIAALMEKLNITDVYSINRKYLLRVKSLKWIEP
jgi:hypothetical protein